MCDYYLSQQVNQSSSVKVPVSLQFQLQANDNWTSKWSKIIAGAQAPGGGGLSISTPAVSPPFSTGLPIFEIILKTNNFVC